MDFEFIDESDIESVKRGRKSSVPPELVEAIKSLPMGKAVVVKTMALDPTDPDYKSHKATVSATLRTAGRQAGTEVSISFTPKGVPQVKRRPSKGKTKK